MKELTKINIPEGVKNIPNFMFDGCINLEEIALPNSCESIGSSAFRGCNRLKLITTGPKKPNIAYGAIPPRTKLMPRR